MAGCAPRPSPISISVPNFPSLFSTNDEYAGRTDEGEEEDDDELDEDYFALSQPPPRSVRGMRGRFKLSRMIGRKHFRSRKAAAGLQGPSKFSLTLWAAYWRYHRKALNPGLSRQL